MYKKLIFILILTLSMVCSCSKYKNTTKNQNALAQEEAKRNLARENAFIDSVYLHMPEVAFVAIVNNLADSTRHINKLLIVSHYLRNKVLYDGITVGYKMREDQKMEIKDDPLESQVIHKLNVDIKNNMKK